MYRFFASLRRLWAGCGEPFPDFIRFMRYNMLGRIWPVYRDDHHASPAFRDSIPRGVAVIIPCHNYGHYLREALDSVLAQTVKPTDILVVDDASDDDTAEIATSYASHGVRLLQVNHHSLALTRNSGAQATTAPYLLYLDADDRLPKNYIQQCLDVMTDRKTALAYGDRAEFGTRRRFHKAPEFSEELLIRNNFISSHALILRDAFDLVGGYRKIDGSLEDWDFYRRVIAAGYTARHAKTVVHYRMHDKSMGFLLRQDPDYSYKRAAALAYHPVTVFTPLTGNSALFERHLEALLQLQTDPQYIRLHWFNVSADSVFDAQVRAAIGKLPFGRITYTQTPLPHGHNAQARKMRVYDEMIRSCDTEYVMLLEEDIRIPPSILGTLQQAMDHDFAAVIAPCKSLSLPRYEMWHRTENGDVVYPHALQATGIEYVSGADSGCALFRTHALRSIAPISRSAQETADELIYRLLAHHGRIMCDWNSEVERMDV